MDERWEKAKKLRDEIKADWAELWKDKYQDKIVAEEISPREFKRLYVDKGEIIYATRDYKPLSFSDILSRYMDAEMADRVDPDPKIGGWGKFIREQLPKKRPVKKRERPRIKFDITQHQRKGGAGSKNQNRIARKTKQTQ